MARIMILLLLSVTLIGWADDFRLELAYFDFEAGPLTVDGASQIALPDGCYGQLIEDAAGDGINGPQPNGQPGTGDVLLPMRMAYTGLEVDSFVVNGQAAFGSAGFFVSDPLLAHSESASPKIFVRIWNANSPLTSTAYWDSPLQALLAGRQQISFAKSEWSYHRFAQHAMTSQDDEGSAAGARHDGVVAFPNPFNASTTLTFWLEAKSSVRLAVYDVNGRLTALLVDRELEAGKHDFVMDSNRMASGVYFARFSQGDRTNIQKILLIR